ncbi:hypothetical protein ACGFNV_39560 [Streptomyces sp. NPDC048751]|uniref:hypothetical protein n=1 Tax=Streptomyces sp. NPDC048751 TaxID=3365591 RepID=UPI00370FE689
MKAAPIPRRIFQFAHDPAAVPPLCRDSMSSVSEFAGRYAYEYRLLTLDDLPSIMGTYDSDAPLHLMPRCRNFGDLSDVLRNLLIDRHGGWWLDWDMHVVHPRQLDDWLNQNSDFEWTGVIDDTNDIVANGLQGGVAHNKINLGFLEWVASNLHGQDQHASFFLAGVHEFTRYLKSVGFVDRRLRLVPMSHTLQAFYSEIKGSPEGVSVEPSPANPQPVFHHWVHGWEENSFDVPAWVKRNLTG